MAAITDEFPTWATDGPPARPRDDIRTSHLLRVPLPRANGLPVKEKALVALSGDHRRVPDLGDRQRRQGGTGHLLSVPSPALPMGCLVKELKAAPSVRL